MSGVDVRIRFTWSAPRPVTVNDRGHLAVGELPAVPGVYRWTLSGAPGQDRPAVYIGEGASLRARIGNYRRPSQMRTAGELHSMFVDHLRSGGRVALEVTTDAAVEPSHGGDPLTRRSLRRLVEGAAIAAEYAAGRTDVLNHDTEQDDRRKIGEGTRDSLAAKRAAGVRLGRPSVLPADVVARIVAERAGKATLRAIAEGLTADGVPTARGGTVWSTSSVQAVLAGQDAARHTTVVTA